MLVGALIGTVTASTKMADVNLVMYIAMAVFAAAFVILNFIPIEDPELGKVTADTKFEHSPWSFRHCTLGVIAIFVYVGVEVGIPSGLNFFLSDSSEKGAGLVENAATIGGAVAAMYWLLMLIGRMVSGFIAGKVSSRQLMLGTTFVGMILILSGMLLPKTITVTMPLFNIMTFSFTSAVVPISVLLLVLCGLCTSIMWASIFNLATEGLGKYTAQASGIFMMMVVGGGVVPVIQNFFADMMGYMPSYFVYLLAMAYMFYYALIGCKNVNKDIPVD
jgi:FHS family L-fucose permease-like MFS transporter